MRKSKNLILIISSFSGGPGDVLKNLIEYSKDYNIYCISLTKSYRDDILDVIKNKSSQYWILNKKSKFSFNIYFELKSIFKEVNPSVVFSFDFASNVLSRLLLKSDMQWFPMIRGLESAFVPWRAIVQKQTFKRVNKLIVPSDALIKKTLRYELVRKDKIRRIYNGTKLESKKKDISNFHYQTSFTVGMVANFYDEIKGHKYAIETISKLPNNFNLEFIGDGILLEDIKKRVRDLKLSDRIIFHGYLEKEKIIELMCERFDVLLVPSLSESFGKVIIEAMSVGLPVIGTNIGGIPEIIVDGETGYLVESRSSEQMAQKIQTLAKDCEKYKMFSENAIKRVEESFDVEKMAKRYFEVIDEN